MGVGVVGLGCRWFGVGFFFGCVFLGRFFSCLVFSLFGCGMSVLGFVVFEVF